MGLAEKLIEEIRREQRRRVYRGGRVYYHNHHKSQDCVIRDLSMNGARIEFEHPHIGPRLLTLQIGSGDLVKARVSCDVKWRKGKWMGVEFLQPLE